MKKKVAIIQKHMLAILWVSLGVLLLVAIWAFVGDLSKSGALYLAAILWVVVLFGLFVFNFFKCLIIFRKKGDRSCSVNKIFEQIPVGIVLSDATGARIYVNTYWKNLTHLSQEQAEGDGWRKVIHPEDLSQVLNCWKNVRQEHKSETLAWRFLLEDGSVHWMRGTVLPLFDEDNQIKAYMGVMDEITQIRHQEAQLLASSLEIEQAHNELESVLNASSDPIVSINTHYELVVFNAAYSQFMSDLYGVQVVSGKNLAHLMHAYAADWEKRQVLWESALQGERFLVRQEFIGKGAVLRTYDLSLSAQFNQAGEVVGAVMVMRDVTAAAQISNALKRSEELFRAVTESNLDAVIVLEAREDEKGAVTDFVILECNRIALSLFQCERTFAIERSLKDVMPSRYGSDLFSALSRVYESGVVHVEEHKLLDHKEEVVWLRYQISLISNGLTLVIRDISEQKKLQNMLFKINVRTSAILAHVHEGVLTLDFQGVIQSANPACVWMFDRAIEELIGQRLDILFPQVTDALSQNGLFQTLQEELGVESEVTNIVKARKKNGELMMLEMSCKPVLLEGESFCTVTLHDVTERNAYENRLQQKINELQSLQDSLNQTNEQLYKANHDLTLLAHQDGLTGLANRRSFDVTLQNEWQRALRDHLPLSIVMLDIDHFKRYNDGYGHQAGDECLALVANAIRSALHRPADFAARYGGEEFVIILPNTDISGAEQIVQWILEDLHRQAIPHANSLTSAFVTVSAGVACSSTNPSVSANLLLEAADQALYRAKQLGRNRVVLAGI